MGKTTPEDLTDLTSKLSEKEMAALNLASSLRDNAYDTEIMHLLGDVSMAELLEALDKAVNLELGKDVKNMFNLLVNDAADATDVASSMPQRSLRMVARSHSNPDEAANNEERQSIWKQVISNREKFCRLGHISDKNKSGRRAGRM